MVCFAWWHRWCKPTFHQGHARSQQQKDSKSHTKQALSRHNLGKITLWRIELTTWNSAKPLFVFRWKRSWKVWKCFILKSRIPAHKQGRVLFWHHVLRAEWHHSRLLYNVKARRRKLNAFCVTDYKTKTVKVHIIQIFFSLMSRDLLLFCKEKNVFAVCVRKMAFNSAQWLLVPHCKTE